MKRKKTIYGLATLMVLVLFASLAFAQVPTAVVKIEGYSPQEIHDMGWTSPRSTGLSNVGVNQVVYLIGRDSLNAAVTTYAWSLAAKPAGSNAVLDSTNKKQTTFKPDVVGKFNVQLLITTAGGTSKARTVTINAAKFVGVGGMDGLPTDVAAGQCALCHSTNFNQWTKTGHSDMLKRGLNGTLSAGYREACIECHTTGYDKEANGNDGFDDVQAEVGWMFPPTLKAGNYDTLLVKYPKLAHRANIQCESCHGPGSAHLGNKENIAMSLDEAVCGYCHEEAPYHRRSTQWKSSLHAVGIASASTNVTSGCVKCHSGWAFIRRVDPIPNDKRPDRGFPQISCAVCHDQHRADLPSQVRNLDNVTLGDSVTVVNYGGLGKVCMQCHISRRDAEDYTSVASNLSAFFGPHYSNQADMLDGSNAIEYGIPIGTSGHKFAVQDACVTCHMQATPATGQASRDKVGEHTFAMKWDGGTPDNPADDVEHVAVCQTCHGPIKSFDDILAKADFDQDGTIEGTRLEIEGMIAKLDKLLPPRTSTTVVRQNFDWTLPGLSAAEVAKRKAYTKAWYNWRFVVEDGSNGVHNAGYSIALLQRAIASITTGDIGAGKIVSITDVPNDQGKQVRVAWSKFPGDGVSANPINGYSLWRRVDNNVAAGEITPVASKETMLALASAQNVGKRYRIAQAGTWDFVAWIPSAGYEFYSMVAPTLYDSTSKGIRWSVFFAAGHARGQLYETAPDSGYSVDNLKPAPPSNVVASILADNKVSLKWADPVDADFQYFAIYRSITAGFDPKGTQPLKTLTDVTYKDNDVVIGGKYYYRISTFDFAGNESAYSPEISAIITKVNERGGGVPTAYALSQNYPNPFNPETTIKYELPASGHVRLSIYTALGQEVRRVVDYTQPAAYHQVVWDGCDNAGNPMPSGLYFYRLETEKFTAVKKMVMMR